MKKNLAILAVFAVILAGWILYIIPKPGPALDESATQSSAANIAASPTRTHSMFPVRPLRTASDPTPSVAVAPTNAPATKTNLLVQIMDGVEMPKLTLEQVQPYLEANRRNAESLLAARQATGDQAFLKEAMQKFPNDPRVAYAGIFVSDATPQEKRQWLDTFKQSDPQNALANFLSASDYIKSGDKASALQEMTAAATKPTWDDFGRITVQNAEEAYLAAGYSTLDAKTAASAGLLLPQLAQLKSLAQGMAETATNYRQAGDAQSAQSTLQMTLDMGAKIAGPTDQSLITTLVGMAIEKIALSQMPPTDPLGDTGGTVQDRINALTQQRTDTRALVKQFDGIMRTLPDTEVIAYLDRQKTFGELPAMQWLMGKYGTK
jgi:hypothetical protein